MPIATQRLPKPAYGSYGSASVHIIPSSSQGVDMPVKFIPILAILILFVCLSSASAQLKKIRFSTTGVSPSELPFKVAQLKGFYREDGLDVEVILIRGAVGMQALLG